MRPAFRQANHILNHEYSLLRTSVPLFLCPALVKEPSFALARREFKPQSRQFSSFIRNRQEAVASRNEAQEQIHHEETPRLPAKALRALPLSCPGCGAPAQILDKNDAGYYNLERNAVKQYLEYDPTKAQEQRSEEDIYRKALQQLDSEILEQTGMDKSILNAPSPRVEPQAPQTPICDRCHNLIHHSIGTPIAHPTIDSIKATIGESPHQRNHIYHVLDAADFPLSLIPNLQSSLKLPKHRTQNRRAKHRGWMSGDRIAEVSFIITRSDLLVPLKEQADKLMPYMQDVLRTALGRVGRKLRLGNVHMVSAKRGWWTKAVKESIWERGGAGWMVGKVNVGKSALFEVVFPKGRTDQQDVRKIRSKQERENMLSAARSMKELQSIQEQLLEEDEAAARAEKHSESNTKPKQTLFPDPKEEDVPDVYDEHSLLPPPQQYTPFPTLPVATSLPGTTASPIRVPFGNKKGELIDLPGLARTTPDLSSFVKPEKRDDLVMKSRIAAERHVLKRGQSLVLGGGLIRITPRSDAIFIVSPFTPLEPHISSTEKAATLQDQTRESGVPSIVLPGVGEQMKSAGTFPLKWDVTKKLAGPLTSPVAGKMKPENLPFVVWATDILVEGVGWIEVSCQVRKGRTFPLGKKLEQVMKSENRVPDALEAAGLSRTPSSSSQSAAPTELYGDERDAGLQFPEIEVFSPMGKFVGTRKPMCASVLAGRQYVSKRERKARPRQSMIAMKARRKRGD